MLQLEKQLENIGVRSQKELILLHREDAAKGFRISHTVDWLNARGWICAHHHVRLYFIQSINEFDCSPADEPPILQVTSTIGLFSRAVDGYHIGSSSVKFHIVLFCCFSKQFHVSRRSQESLSLI